MTLSIALSSYVGQIGDGITITASGAVFNEPHTKNVVTFNGVIANILSGTTTQLIATVPLLATSGPVVVETFRDVVAADQSATSSQDFVIQYVDDAFPDNVKEPDPYHKGYINDRVKTLGTDPSNTAKYNRDFGYSNFVEVVDENSMIQNFISLILTRFEERMGEPEMGSTIPELPYSLIDVDSDQLEEEILNEADRLVKEYEPRITLIKSQSMIVMNPDDYKINGVFAIQVPSGAVREVGVTLGQIQNETM